MKVLLDTHTLLWCLADDPRLSGAARAVVEDPRHIILVSAISAWEIAIKRALGRLDAPDDLERAVEDAGFVAHRIGFSEMRHLEKLPSLHQDPFDRMLIAQALEEGVPIVTRDAQIRRYPVQTIW